LEITAERIILGIDPGTRILGYAVLQVLGKKLELLQWGVLDLTKTEPAELRYYKIFHHIMDLLDKHSPDELAIEAPFYGKNVQSMLKLGRAQGLCIAAALSRQIPYAEYAPRLVKQQVTGKGAASKEEVARFVQLALGLADLPEKLDASDALAVAICHAGLQGNGNVFQPKSKPKKSTGTYQNWSDFVKKKGL
jgi:crossover junction endodeoxyribonuclease RuvC